MKEILLFYVIYAVYIIQTLLAFLKVQLHK